MEVRIKVNLRQVWDLPDRGTGEQERSDAGRALLVPKHQAAHKVIMVMVMVMVVIMMMMVMKVVLLLKDFISLLISAVLSPLAE